MLQLDPTLLPSSAELPGSDDTPVDNEDQNFVPNVLLFLLESLWETRDDWYFGIDMGIYHATGSDPRVPIVPDGFLSVGVERRKGGKSRKSYVMWEEQNIPPAFVLEVVSETPGGEYSRKLDIYAKLGVRYYAIYNPCVWKRDGHAPLEIYTLESGTYRLQTREPYWMPEIGLGLGRYTPALDPLGRELLGWFDEKGDRYLTDRERVESERQRAESERQRAESERQRADRLAEYLRSQGINPDNLPDA
ncbi:MAG: Uma2 family endonuclease [Cyanobacteria bacterium J06642_2]